MAKTQGVDDFLVPKDTDKLISWLDRKLETGKTRLPERQMKLNLAYMLGEQYLVWDKERKQFRRPKVTPDDANAPIRVTVNKIGSITEHFISRLTKANPEPECRPVTDDESDVGAAKVSTRIMSHEMDRIQFKDLLTRLYFWVVPLGWSYLQVTWNPNGGDPIGEVNGKPVHEGETDVELVPGFEIGIDPNSKDPSLIDAKWGFRTVTMTREAIWDRWGVTVEAETQRSLSMEVYDLVDQVSDARSPSQDSDVVAVHQFWLRPGSRSKPEGMVVTWCGKTILEKPVPFPYKHGRLPWVQTDLLPGVGTREGRTWLKDLIPLQADYNDARSREAAIRRTLTPKLLFPTGSIDPQRVTSAVEAIPYNPIGEKPTWDVPNSSWMNQHEQAMNRADAEMGERAGQSDATGGGGDAKGMPAAAILALQEADDTKLAVSAKLLAAMVEQLGWMILSLARQFWTEGRIVRTWSEEGELDVDRFTGADISHQLDVRVQTESALPRSKAARAQLAQDLWGAQIITDPRLFVRMLDIPGTDFIVESLNMDAKRAERENGALARGEQREVETWDNHQIHLQKHNDYRKTQEYEKLDPDAKMVFDAHCEIHNEMILGQMGVPTAPGTPQFGMAGEGGPGNAEALQPGMYIDGMTGMPPDSVMAGAGLGPSALSQGPESIREAAGIGGAGQPGAVPGMSADSQAGSMGA